MKFFLAKERASREMATMGCEEERREREKTSGSWLGLKSHFHADDMQMTAVKHVKLLIKK